MRSKYQKDNGVMKLNIQNNEGTEYKDAVEQIHLSTAEKEEMLADLLEKTNQAGISTQEKKRKLRLLPAYAGGIAAAAILLVFVWPGKGSPMDQSVKDSHTNTGAMKYNEAQMEDSSADELQGAEDIEMSVDEAGDSSDAESVFMENEAEMSTNVADGVGGEILSGFHIVAFAADIKQYDDKGNDRNKTTGKVSQEEQHSDAAIDNTDAKHSGITMRKGECYYTFSETAPGCNVAIQTEDGQNYDDYVVRGYGCHFVKKEGQAVADTIHVGADVKFYMELKEESEIDREMSHQIMQQDCNWSDKKIKTAAYIVIEAMKDGAVAESQTVYIGKKGNMYYGMIY